MSQERKDQFEQSFQGAVKASLQVACACETLRARVMLSLSEHTPAPDHVEESALDRFQEAFCHAVSRCQDDIVVEDSVALRIEAALGREMRGRDLLSERSVNAAIASGQEALVDAGKARFTLAYRSAVATSQTSLTATPACRERIEAALSQARQAGPSLQVVSSKNSNVVPFKPRPLWKRGLTAVASVAAGFAVLMGTLFGSAERALASSVQRDHERCCVAIRSQITPQSPAIQAIEETKYGKLPRPPIKGDWKLVFSRECRGEDGSPMFHNLYLRGDEKMSLHFIPPGGDSDLPKEMAKPREVGTGAFPVMAWTSAGWTVTACSEDLDESGISDAIGAAKP